MQIVLIKTIELHLEKYDIIIAGAGLSGLTAALEMAGYAYFREKRILLIDREEKKGNDRTWCFWEEHKGADADLMPVRSRTWKHMQFISESGEMKKLRTGSYRYAMLRSSDFYAYAQAELDKCTNLNRIVAQIQKIEPESGKVITDNGAFLGEYVLNSAFLKHPLLSKTTGVEWWRERPFTEGEQQRTQDAGTTYLLQHFKGWFIKTADRVFDPEQIFLMDYRTRQAGDTRFFYVLPLSDREALVEYTVFSDALLEYQEQYDEALRIYLRDILKIRLYTIEETEFGVIPMSDFAAARKAEGRVVHIGTAGGTVKASSGYGFKSTRKRMRQFVADWAEEGRPDPALLQSRFRFGWFDRILLGVLEHKYLSGADVFTVLFFKHPAERIFRFLDERSTWLDDFSIIVSVPSIPFLRSLFDKIRKMRTLRP